ncbi:MAG: 2Fe-2S iron-sulfur cluster-binding protein [Afipia sp.]|nr:2Fe-2S iron-sulfur cluster-binding protein [Afipia sp.]
MSSTATVNARRLGQSESGDSSKARLHRMKVGDLIRVRISRFDPTKDQTAYYDEYEVPYSKMMRVLDVLNFIAEDLEQDFAYRWFCGVKKCGTCAVRMNGREVLSCWESAEPEMLIEPLRHAPIIRDLVIDRAPYENLIGRLMPWLERKDAYAGWPERISHRDMEDVTNALDCLSCMCCVSACPVLDLGDETNFSGPAPLVQLAQMALDPRDNMDRGALAVDVAGIFNCVSCYKCEEACPVGIPVVSGIIEPLKAMAALSRPGAARHSLVFADIIQKRGRIDPSELILRTQGLFAFAHLGRVFRLLVLGKINLARTLFGKPISLIEKVRDIFERTRKTKI